MWSDAALRPQLSSRRDRTTTWALAAGTVAATAGLAALYYFGRRSRRSAAVSEEDREKVLKIMDELSLKFFNVCQDLAAIAKTVRTKMEANRVEIGEGKLREQLARQMQVFEKLADIEAQVASKFSMDPVSMQQLQKRSAEDSTIRKLAEEFRTMLEDALGGVTPILPGAPQPKALTEEKALAVLAEVQALEQKQVQEKVGKGKCSLKELGEVLAWSHQAAWEKTLAAHQAELLEGRPPEVFHSVMSMFMRNEDFVQERKKQDDLHQQRMIKMFQPDGRVGGAAGPAFAMKP